MTSSPPFSFFAAGPSKGCNLARIPVDWTFPSDRKAQLFELARILIIGLSVRSESASFDLARILVDRTSSPIGKRAKSPS
jgi:hypothetical protein